MGVPDKEPIPSDPPPAYSPAPETPFNPSLAGPSTAPRPPLNTRPSARPEQLTPTEIPTPGRPLLRDGQFLVYKSGVFCHKCQSGRRSKPASKLRFILGYNTGYKNDDPYHPCKSVSTLSHPSPPFTVNERLHFHSAGGNTHVPTPRPSRIPGLRKTNSVTGTRHPKRRTINARSFSIISRRPPPRRIRRPQPDLKEWS